MQNEWILDVLSDLKTFAQQNGLGGLAEQLDDTRLFAATELAIVAEGKRAHDKPCSAIAVRNPVEHVGKRL